MAAISTLMLAVLKPGDKVLTHFSLYGGTDELLEKILPPLNISADIVDLRDLNKAEDAMKKGDVKMLYLETPANPTIQCVDLEELCKLAKKYRLVVACDNTFASPYLQQPFRHGADFVIHSTTKFLNGHGTAIGGILLGKDMELMKGHVTKVHRLLGGNSNPFDAFLLIQGIKTLELRMERHCSNAMEVANFLDKNNAVEKVNYTGLNSHPDYAVAKKQMRHSGGMLSFELKKGLQGGIDFMNKLKMCVRTVSLGTCDTLLSHPASMSHAGVPKEQRIKYGITDGLIRMNVGIENVQDILNDLEQALSSKLGTNKKSYFDSLWHRLQRPAIREQMKKLMNTNTQDWENTYYGAGGAKGVLLLAFKKDSLRKYIGKTLDEVSKIRGTSPEETAMNLIVEDSTRIGVAYFSMDSNNVKKEIALPWMSFCSDESSQAPEGVFLKTNPHPRAYGSFIRVLGKFSRDEKAIPLQQAIYQLAKLPATNLKLQKRGELKAGNYADIVIFDPSKVKDNATFARPHQYATGVEHVFVNGVQVIKDGEHTGAKPGRFLKGTGYKMKN